MKSKLGVVFCLAYVAVAAYLIGTQGLTGESFVSLILGMPWTLALAAVEFGGAEGIMLYALLIIPIALNAFLLYKLGSYIAKRQA